MEVKLKEINSQRIKISIVCLVLQTILTLSLLIAAIAATSNSDSLRGILLTWFFGLYFLYGNIWLGFIVALELKANINENNDVKILFSGIGSIISLFSLIIWIIFVREIYFDKKYSIGSIDKLDKSDEKPSSKGE